MGTQGCGMPAGHPGIPVELPAWHAASHPSCPAGTAPGGGVTGGWDLHRKTAPCPQRAAPARLEHSCSCVLGVCFLTCCVSSVAARQASSLCFPATATMSRTAPCPSPSCPCLPSVHPARGPCCRECRQGAEPCRQGAQGCRCHGSGEPC